MVITYRIFRYQLSTPLYDNLFSRILSKNPHQQASEVLMPLQGHPNGGPTFCVNGRGFGFIPHCSPLPPTQIKKNSNHEAITLLNAY